MRFLLAHIRDSCNFTKYSRALYEQIQLALQSHFYFETGPVYTHARQHATLLQDRCFYMLQVHENIRSLVRAFWDGGLVYGYYGESQRPTLGC